MFFPVIIATRIRSEAGSDTVAPVIQSGSWSASTGFSITVLEADSLPVDLLWGTYDSAQSNVSAVVAGTGAYDNGEIANSPEGTTNGTFADFTNTPAGSRVLSVVARDDAGNLSSSVTNISFTQGGAATVSALRTAQQGANGISFTSDTYTFSAVPAPNPSGTRKLVASGVLASGPGTDSIQGITIFGVVGTQRVAISNGNASLYVFEADVPTGTSGDIVITGNFGISHITTGFSLFEVQNGTFQTSSQATNSDTLTLDVNTSADDVVLAFLMATNGTTWGVSGLSGLLSQDIRSNEWLGSASETVSAGTPLALSATSTSPAANSGAVLVYSAA